MDAWVAGVRFDLGYVPKLDLHGTSAPRKKFGQAKQTVWSMAAIPTGLGHPPPPEGTKRLNASATSPSAPDLRGLPTTTLHGLEVLPHAGERVGHTLLTGCRAKGYGPGPLSPC